MLRRYLLLGLERIGRREMLKEEKDVKTIKHLFFRISLVFSPSFSSPGNYLSMPPTGCLSVETGSPCKSALFFKKWTKCSWQKKQ